MSYYLEKKGGLELKVRVQPKASRNQLEGVRENQLRIRLTAPPVDNAANQAIVAFVADLMGVAKSKVTLTAGHKSRDKTLFVTGDPGPLKARIESELSELDY